MITIYESYDEIFRIIPHNDFFNTISARRLLKNRPEYDAYTSDWNFTVFHGTLRFCTGNTDSHTWVRTPFHVGVSWLKKAWYLCYCELMDIRTHIRGKEIIKYKPVNRVQCLTP